jgi:hypothetical protein
VGRLVVGSTNLHVKPTQGFFPRDVKNICAAIKHDVGTVGIGMAGLWIPGEGVRALGSVMQIHRRA